MSNHQPHSKKGQIKKPVIASTMADKLKRPEYSVDKSTKKSGGNLIPMPKKPKS